MGGAGWWRWVGLAAGDLSGGWGWLVESWVGGCGRVLERWVELADGDLSGGWGWLMEI